MRIKALENFFAGAACVGTGCRAFCGDRRTWKYVLLPWALMIGTYGLLFRGVFALTGRLADRLNEQLANLPEYLTWLNGLCQWSVWLLAGLGALLLLALTASAFYAALGGIFFDALAEYRLREKYGMRLEPFSWRRMLRLAWASGLFSLETLLVGGAAFVLSWLLPVAGPVLLGLVFGYYLAISLMIGAANCAGVDLPELRRRARAERAAVLGFGVTAYLLLMIPFALLLFLPCLVLGGADLFAGHLTDAVPNTAADAPTDSSPKA